MPITAQMHDGTRLEFPDGTDPAVIQSTVKNLMAGKVAPAEPQRERTTIAELGRQVALTGRAGINGLANTVGILSNPIASALNLAGMGADKLLGTKIGARFGSAADAANTVSDTIGLAKPENAQERVVQDATGLMAGAGGSVGAANLLARSAAPVLSQVAPSSLLGRIGESATARAAGTRLAAAPAQQVGAAVGSGLAGGITREQGGSGWEQFAASLLGGVVGGMGAGAVANKMAASRAAVPMQEIEARLAAEIQQRTGTPWQEIPQALRAQLTAQAAESLKVSGKLPGEAAARMVDFEKLGIEPLAPWITRDPVKYSQMMNLRGTDAGVPIQRSMADANTKLIQALNRNAPAAPGTPMQRGEQVIADLAGKDKAMSARVGQQYDAYRATVGKDLEVPLQNYAGDLTALVDDFGAAFPSSIKAQLQKIGLFDGQQTKTVTLADTESWLKRMNSVPASNQAEKAAQSAVRGVIQRMQTELAGSSDLAGEAATAAQAARGAAAARFKWQDAVPLVKDIIRGDAAPDRLIEQTVMSRSASTKDIQNLMMSLDEGSRNAIRAEVVDTLKRAALSGAADEVGVVSQAAYNKALQAFPKEKLTALLGDATDDLYRIGRAASYMQKYPAGESVNTSKTAGVLMGHLAKLGRNAPVVGPMVAQPLENLMLQRQVAQLMAPGIGAGRASPLLPNQSAGQGFGAGAPALTAGLLGLLSAQPADERQYR